MEVKENGEVAEGDSGKLPESPNDKFEIIREDFYTFKDPEDYLKLIKSYKLSDGSYQIVTLSNSNRYVRYNLTEEDLTIESVLQETYGTYEFDLISPDCILISAKDKPPYIKNWNDGTFSSFRCRNHLEEYISPVSVKYSNNKAYFGFKNQAQVFDITRMDKEKIIPLKKKMVLAIGVHEDKDLLALGYQLHDLRTHKSFGAIPCTTGSGCTQVEFDDCYALTAARNDNWVYLWDLRNDSQPVENYYRDAQTCQRMYFSFDQSTKRLLVGSKNGSVTLYDIHGRKVDSHFPIMFDCVSCCDIIDNQYLQVSSTKDENPVSKYLCIAGSGQRHYKSFEASESDSEIEEENPASEYRNAIRIFSF
ncbi:unnamed protein product [Moneuplotes crassus]|uniref:Uncharacterized protein n=1 Tax=Euplotes crassus TaxID=5936 RepID=A0AAD1XH33_EUPCR|nr:unnamed protein product [Moneuplotes crassus]